MAEVSNHLTKKNFDRPDETRTYDHLMIDIVQLGHVTLSRNTYRAGWSWSESVEPWAQTSACQTEHTFYVVSGHIRLKTDGGEELEFGPGDLGLAPAGHQAWTVGGEAAEVIDFGGHMCTYGERL